MRRTLPTLLLLLAGTGQAVTLTVWTHYVGGDRDWLTLQTRAFTASTGHRVQILTVPFDELGPRWAAADRTGPDVVVGVPDEWLAAAAPWPRRCLQGQVATPKACGRLPFRAHCGACP
ncbi:hypothetical protein [Deinococcus multiflagellatus]|uniref:Uncharacterized protein n=1 Tax=Deinococcus multiflagellatus TaxID=1656887 RepID=A0ABW1ZDY6_9DEIO